MRIFTPKCGKWTLLGFAIFFVLISIVLIFFTDDIVDAVKDQVGDVILFLQDNNKDIFSNLI